MRERGEAAHVAGALEGEDGGEGGERPERATHGGYVCARRGSTTRTGTARHGTYARAQRSDRKKRTGESALGHVKGQ